MGNKKHLLGDRLCITCACKLGDRINRLYGARGFQVQKFYGQVDACASSTVKKNLKPAVGGLKSQLG